AVRFERALATVRQHLQWAEADMAAPERKREARQKLDAARLNLDRAEALRPGTWQVEQLLRLYAQSRRKLIGFEMSPKLKLYEDCAGCPEMVELPPGSFKMGSPDRAPDSYEAERPQHKVTIAKGFAIGRFEVTVREFELFVRAENYT